MHDVRLVLEQLVDAFDDVPLAQHQPVLHVGLQSEDKVYPVEEFFLYVAPVGEHLPVEVLCEHAPHAPVPVVHVGRRQAEGDDVARVVAEQVQLEAVAPSHRALAVLGNAREHLVETFPDIVAHRYQRAIDERDAGVHRPKAYMFMKSISLTKPPGISSTKRL